MKTENISSTGTILASLELVEFLNVAITESGCPGEQWAMIALKTYSGLEAGKKFDAADICCRDENNNWME